jgi:hypothetical protein
MTNPLPRSRRGRKTEIPGEKMTRVIVTVDSMTRRKLAVLGQDNISLGVRVAASAAYRDYQTGRLKIGETTDLTDD